MLDRPLGARALGFGSRDVPAGVTARSVGPGELVRGAVDSRAALSRRAEAFGGLGSLTPPALAGSGLGFSDDFLDFVLPFFAVPGDFAGDFPDEEFVKDGFPSAEARRDDRSFPRVAKSVIPGRA